MIARISKRYASAANPNIKARKGGKGGVTAKPQCISHEEHVCIIQRRTEKAGRDEHMDIAMALTPVKTYMGGFARPHDLRALYWSEGSLYNGKRSYEAPPDTRMTTIDRTMIPSKVATTGQQIRTFYSSTRRLYPSESYNEEHIVPSFYIKHKKDRKKRGDDMLNSPVTPSTTSPSATDAIDLGVKAAEETAHDPARRIKAIRRRKNEESALMQHLSDSILDHDLAASTRRLVTKIPVEHYDDEGNLVHPSGFVVPGKGHTSSSNPARAKERSRDEDEERVAQTAAVAERVLESDLDHVHSAMATTRPRSHKVPFEVREPDGTVKHPSGFVPPTPANEFKYSDSASLERGLSSAISRQRARDVGSLGSSIIKGRGLHTSVVARACEAVLPLQFSQPAPAPEINSQVSSGFSEGNPDYVSAIRAKYVQSLAGVQAEVDAIEQEKLHVFAEKKGCEKSER